MMDLEARRAELEHLVMEQFISSPEAWYEGWKFMAGLYEEGEVYATAMACRLLARNHPAGATPPEEIAVFKNTFEACYAIDHEEKKHDFGPNGFCASRSYGCGATIAGSKYISEQNRMVYEA